MADDGNERLTGDLKSAEGGLVQAGLAVELDKMGGIHVAVFRLPRGKLKGDEALTLHAPGGRTIDLYVLADGFQPDGTVRAAVVKDSGAPGYGLGLDLDGDSGLDLDLEGD